MKTAHSDLSSDNGIFGDLLSARRQDTLALIALLLIDGLTAGCVFKQPCVPEMGVCGMEKPDSPSSAQAGFGEETVITGTATPHRQKDSPVETERISGKMLEQAGASRIGQVLQDIPAVQSRR